MTAIADLRLGRSPNAPVVAAASTSVPIALVAWVSWQVLEGDSSTLVRSQFSYWAWVTVGCAAVTCAASAAFWRSRRALLAATLGTVLAGLGVVVGLLVDMVGSGGLA